MLAETATQKPTGKPHVRPVFRPDFLIFLPADPRRLPEKFAMYSTPWVPRPCASRRVFSSIRSLRAQVRAALIAALVLLGSEATTAQTGFTSAIPDLITRPIDNAQRSILRGNVHPLASAASDRGNVPAVMSMRRMLLVLKRSDAQDSALKSFLADQQTKGSAHFHQWLTPEDFGKQFGPSNNDIQQVTAWLNARGFQVGAVAKGRTAIEFSGTAGQVNEAFGTTIHKFEVKGEEHFANATDPSIPAALSPLVGGILTLHNFPRHSNAVIHGQPVRPAKGDASSYFTFTSGQSAYYGLGPTDFATIYDLLPLWNAGIDGSGQSIAIVGETNINTGDVDAFRNLFGLPKNTPKVILNGPDPGIIGDETEALLDVSWSGAVAKNATIDFVASASTETSLGVDLSALYIVDNDLAPVMSESYGDCEAVLGSAGNAFYNALWQQAAAEGITVLVSAGDAGSAVCDDFNSQSYAFNGLAVSGFASTPYNVAVGGTDFDQSAANYSTYWNLANDPNTQSSAKSYIPETTWNQSCGADGVDGCGPNATALNIVAGSGGQSNCSRMKGDFKCLSGYPKPAWQTGIGVPQDGVRDLPDISLFASSGFNGSFYIICEADFSPFGPMPGLNQPCSLSSSSLNFVGIGGTSASTPAFAGIMALVNQKTNSRQGNANYALYNLAAQKGASCDSSQQATGSGACIFHDITKGNNTVPCYPGSANCGGAATNGYGVLLDPNDSSTPAWTTTPGYDLATGLGTVDANNLVNAWGSTTMAQTQTTLTTLSPTTLAHGQSVDVSATVAPVGGFGTPTGSVVLMASPTGRTLSLDDFPLSYGVASGTTSLLPGGTYNVTARYSGDGNFAASDSTPVQVTVSKENSRLAASLAVYDFNAGEFSYGSTVSYGAIAFLRANVTGEAGASCAPNPQQTGTGCPTGTVNFTSGSTSIDAGSYVLNSLGYTEDQNFALHINAIGNYSVQAQYSGDASYNASQASLNAAVTQAPTLIYYVGISDLTPDFTGTSYIAWSGQTFHVYSVAYTRSVLNAPTGSVSILQDGGSPSGTMTQTPLNGSYSGGFSSISFAYLEGQLATAIDAPGTYTFTASYPGDANYLGSQSPFPITVTVQDTTFNISGSISNVTVARGQSAATAVNFAAVDHFAGPITITCTLPNTMNEASCSSTAASLGNNTTTSSTLTIHTTAAHATAMNRRMGFGSMAVTAMAACLLVGFGKRRRGLFLVLILLILTAAGGVTGCGGSAAGGGGGTSDPGTPGGSYVVSVTATSANITRSANFTVTVQ
jgi:hypothetical protein